MVDCTSLSPNVCATGAGRLQIWQHRCVRGANALAHGVEKIAPKQTEAVEVERGNLPKVQGAAQQVIDLGTHRPNPHAAQYLLHIFARLPATRYFHTNHVTRT